jgi:NADH-quinone oxidoreductase E subunit
MEYKIFNAEFLRQLDSIIAKYDKKQAALLPVLHAIQEKEGFISPESEKAVADYLGIPVVHVREVISFYHLLRRKPQGKCHFAVCQTTSCALLGGEEMIEYLKQKLGIQPGETTADGKFSFSVVECLGACEIAPMMQCNEEYVGPLTNEKIDEIIKREE